jgi:hypothetical protein
VAIAEISRIAIYSINSLGVKRLIKRECRVKGKRESLSFPVIRQAANHKRESNKCQK